jgi:putative methionine-R-sulfoxide reductase with GAF domain
MGHNPNGNGALPESELDSTLQLLVERAQYITGATGTALALPQGEEMVCRASAGASAPAVGARLQVHSGLTGESISRRQLLRCDNAETDPRVNLEACRSLGIASIVVLPLLRGSGEVRGLFELFSDHPYAFEERDLIALERMAALTLTALDLAEQSEGRAVASGEPAEMRFERFSVASPTASPILAPHPPTVPTAPKSESVGAETRSEDGIESDRIESNETAAPTEPAGFHTGSPTDSVPQSAAQPAVVPDPASPATAAPILPAKTSGIVSAPITLPAEDKFSPANESPAVDQQKITESAPSPNRVPEAMRRVQKCASCGFPVSSGRTVCIDCERKDLHDKELQHKEKRDKEKRDKDREKELETRTAENPLPAPPAALQEKTQIEATSLQISDGAPADIVIDDAADASDQFVPAFLANSVPVKESWLSNHVNLLAIVVLILTILVAVVVFR